MSLYVKGIRFEANELAENYVFKFPDLNARGQIRLFLENKNLFFVDAIKSQYKTVRDTALRKKDEVSSKVINQTILMIILGRSFYDSELVIELLKSKKLKLNETNRNLLSKTEYWKIRKIIAQDINTTNKVLKKMFMLEIVDLICHDTDIVLEDIIRNPNFRFKTIESDIAKRYYSKPEFYEKIISTVEKFQKNS